MNLRNDSLINEFFNQQINDHFNSDNLDNSTTIELETKKSNCNHFGHFTEEVVDTTFETFNKQSELSENVKIIRPDKKIEEFYQEGHFIYKKCKNVTTVKIDGRRYSFQTNPQNDKNIFYMKLNPSTFEYDFANPFEYAENYKDSVRIPYCNMKDFKRALNECIEEVREDLVKAQSTRKTNIILITSGLAIVFSLLILFIYHKMNFLDSNTKNIILALLILVAIIVIGYNIYKYKYSCSNMFSIYESLADFQTHVEDIVHKWNNKCFIKYDVKASVPIGLQYIQFILNPDLKLKVFDHEINY